MDELLTDDAFREILTNLAPQDLCLIATVNKRWCYEANSPLLWRDLCVNMNKYIKSFPWQQPEKDLPELASSTLPLIYNDWKRAYIIKVKYRALQERVLCLSNCMQRANHAMPMLDGHQMEPYAHQPLMFERFSLNVLNECDKKSSDAKRPTETDKPCPGLFQQVCAVLGEDVHRAWMVVDTSRTEDLADRLKTADNAIYTTLIGSFFNLTNVHNLPYLVKVDSCLSFCEYVYDTSDGQWCYLFVEHPSLHSYIDSIWYLNYDETLYPTKEIKTMALLRRHLMKCCTWFNRSYFRIGELKNIILMLHIYNQNTRDELFYDVLNSSINDNNVIKSPVVDYFILIDNNVEYFSEKIAVIRSDFVPTKVNLNGERQNNMELVTEYLLLTFLQRAEKMLKEFYEEFKDKDLIPELRILHKEASGFGFSMDRDLMRYFNFYYCYPTFTEDPSIRAILDDTKRDGGERMDLIRDILIAKANERRIAETSK